MRLDERRRPVERVVEVLRADERVAATVLTSSYARGETDGLSDLDVLVGVLRRLLPTTTSTTGAGPAPRHAEASTHEDEAEPKSRRPKPDTAKAATVKDDRDPAKDAHAAVLKLDRDDRERDG
jgi:hypothetical protein